jgi:peroxiredoxin
MNPIFKAAAVSLMVLMFTPGFGRTVEISSGTLTDQLKAKADASAAMAPADKQAIMAKAIEDLRRSGLAERAVKSGQVMPSFTLPDVKRGVVSSQDLLKQGPLVVVFYRGGWCPYCNLELHDLQKYLPEFRKRNAQLVAISPQTPDNSLSTAQKAALTFYVLSDAGGHVARSFGLMYKLPEELVKVYQGFGLDLAKQNGTTDWELPLAATYVVAPDGKIVYSFVDPDYKKRAETRTLLKALDSITR